jgi:REP element-mobilizing transposase RayT
MTLPRSSLISLDDTPYYHCVSRCVRRAFLCGIDRYSGQSFEHRRGWLEQELLKLPQIFCIEVAAYAVMSNHYHIVLHVNEKKVLGLSTREVIERWHLLFKGNLLSQRYLAGGLTSPAEIDALHTCVAEWRNRLSSISWFMRLLNEKIARQANKEDKCTGRFWEGRFKSQALLDEKALAACMAYVDLNPIRAAMAKTPEQSVHTSVRQRIQTAKKATSPNALSQQPDKLMPFAGNPRKDMPEGIPFKLDDYLQLVDWTGRLMREDKRGCIANNLPVILGRLHIAPEQWLKTSHHFEKQFKHFVGETSQVKSFLKKIERKSCHGITNCQTAFT